MKPILKRYSYTCSIGATIYKENEKIEDSFKRADESLYEAKNAGRNQVIIKVY